MKTALPTWQVYGNYQSGNYGAHALVFTDAAGNDFYFSYRTLVAFRKCGDRVVVRQNDWSTTTGKHLNAIDGGNKKARLSSAAFEAAYQAAFGQSIGCAA